MLIPWMREGLDPNINYGVVSNPACQGPPWVRDHFIELQWIRNYMLAFTGALSIDAFNTIVGTFLTRAWRFSLHNLGSIRQLDK